MPLDTIYDCTHARFDGTGRALTETELRKLAPSIFATEAHASRSDRFAPIPTIDVLNGLAREGFSVVAARQSVARTPDRRDYTKHMLRLRRLDDGRRYHVGDSVFELILKNANDGSAAYDLDGGLFRIACLNSLVTSQQTLSSVRVRHTGDAIGKVIEGSYEVLEQADKALAAPQDWSALQMSRDARMALAESAHILRFGEPEEGEPATPIRPEQMLVPRRSEDRAANLWTTFNTVQENAIKGGLSGRHPDGRNERGRWQRGRRVTTRAVQGIDQDQKLNRALWHLAERMAEMLKGGAAAA